ncbi:hypothetical protein GOBAR_DD33547 [Gossypium barbadense]|nr:hypothetical protein GOBAR_DD33547 [Gossypium barbadense]
MPLLHSSVTRSTYQFVLDKVPKKLNDYNVHLLSLAERVTLANVSGDQENGLRIYFGGDWRIPQADTCKVGETCYQPKGSRGLGFRVLASQNKAFLFKVAFALISQPEVYWLQILWAKYKLFVEMVDKDEHWKWDELDWQLFPVMLDYFVATLVPNVNLEPDTYMRRGLGLTKRVLVACMVVAGPKKGDTISTFYGCLVELVLHVLRDCSLTRACWLRLVPLVHRTWFYSDRATSVVALGGVIRDSQGRWLLGFNKWIGRALLIQVGIRRPWEVIVRHIPREENCVVDEVAKNVQLYLNNWLEL